MALPENREIVENLWPESAADWLLVVGDVAERFADIEWALRQLSKRLVSLGYLREWQARGRGPSRPRRVLLTPGSPG